MSTLLIDEADHASAFAAIQTWAGKQAASGKWIDTTASPVLRVDGVGNSWTANHTAGGPVGYTIIGSTMILNLYLPSTHLTIAAATNVVYVQIPDGYLVAGSVSGSTALSGRPHYGTCSLLNNGTSGTGLLTAVPQTAWIAVQFLAGTNFVTSTDFTILGHIPLEVTRS